MNPIALHDAECELVHLSNRADVAILQTIFNTCISHLMHQGHPSFIRYPGGPRCRYRGNAPPRGAPTRCGIGILIPDSEYRPDMENCAIETLMVADNTGKTLKRLLKIPRASRLLFAIQDLHDNTPADLWTDYPTPEFRAYIHTAAATIAAKFNLRGWEATQ